MAVANDGSTCNGDSWINKDDVFSFIKGKCKAELCVNVVKGCITLTHKIKLRVHSETV
jgi:hypothetical protein